MKNKIILCTCIFSLVTFATGCQQNTKTSSSEQNTKTEVSEPAKEMDNVESDKTENEQTNSQEKEEKNTAADKNTLTASIYSYDVDKANLTKNTAEIKELQPQLLIDELIKIKIIPEGTVVNNFNIETVDDVKVIYLDLNSNFVNYSLGSSAEISMLDCVANTFLENYNCKKLKLTINGNEYESGHLAFEKNQYLEFKK